jgi:hypothetical protein
MNEPKPCTPETAALLHWMLDYYREYFPYAVGMTHEKYATTQEAKNADAALKAYRDETGAVSDYVR